jgi:trimeric autotransporter adhesin
MSSISVRIGVTLSIGLMLLAAACTDARKGGTVFDSKTGKHPDTWVADHPAAFLSDTSQCTSCHGSDLTGGISGVSCYSASFNGVSCHPNGPSGHPAGWNDPTQHGTAAKAVPSSSAGFSSCELCHGADFSGGFATTCLNTAGCHGAGVNSPHAFPWQSTSTRKHSTTDPGNAAACGLCHLGDRQPPSYAPLTVPVGCFDNTLCHGQVGHAVGWANADIHGAAAKSAPSATAMQGFSTCQSCHGANFNGGAATTCFTCHGVSAPHASPWTSTSPRKHSTTNAANASSCGLCHLANRQPPSYAVLTVPVGCFDNTLCHGQVGHAVGWANPGSHGAAAKSVPSVTAMQGFSTCQSCHGNDFTGGTSLQTCLNTAGCHGAGVDSPHAAAPWVASVTSTMTHTTTDAANATVCGLCHWNNVQPPTYNAPVPGTPNCFDNTLCHGVEVTLGCVGCHNTAISSPTAQSIDASVTQRRAIVPEFKNTWSHKRSSSGGVPANTVVTNADCAVCHMEGNVSDGSRNLTYHGNGYIELRDPDTGAAIEGVAWNGATPGQYNSSGSQLQFVRFSRNLSSASIEQAAAAIQINHCLKCHDANGATNALAQVPGGSALKPFATTITGQAAPFNSNGNGNVVNVAGSFNPANATYHPVMGKQNNSYAQGTRMVAPWNLAKANGNNTQYGNLISCWDCHAPAGASGVQTSTVTAHGAPATLRAPVRAGGNTAAANLCLNCHATVYATTNTNHGSGSAFGSGGDSAMSTTIFSNCHNCHSYNGAVGATVSAAGTRPNRAEDVHGFDDRDPVTAGIQKWTSGSRPYAFIRNTLSSWAPASATGDAITGAHTCSGTGGTCNNNMNNDSYSPGGVY